jgi:hypothetical protein
MIKTLKQATDFVLQSIKNVDPDTDLDEMMLREILEDRFYEKIKTDKLTEKDIEILDEKMDDEAYVETYFQWKIPNYYTALEETVKEVLSEYLMDLQEETK